MEADRFSGQARTALRWMGSSGGDGRAERGPPFGPPADFR
jgi:hypothetical protein